MLSCEITLIHTLHCFFPWNPNEKTQTMKVCLPHLNTRTFKSPEFLILNTIKVTCLIFRLTGEDLPDKIKAPSPQQWCWQCPGEWSSFVFVFTQSPPMESRVLWRGFQWPCSHSSCVWTEVLMGVWNQIQPEQFCFVPQLRPPYTFCSYKWILNCPSKLLSSVIF